MDNKYHDLAAILDRTTQANTTYDDWKHLVKLAGVLVKHKKEIEDEWYLSECYKCDVSAWGIYDPETDL